MFEKSEVIQFATAIAIGVCSVSAFAQTIDEMADLAKKKTFAEMSKGLRSEEPTPIIAAPKKVVKEDAPLPMPPRVTAIYGPRPDLLKAEVSDGGFRTINMRIGERTPSGWIVEAISTESVTFAFQVPAKAEDQKAKPPRGGKPSGKADKPTHDVAKAPASQFKRVNVLWTPAVVFAGTSAGIGGNAPTPGQGILAPQSTMGGPLPAIPLPSPAVRLSGR